MAGPIGAQPSAQGGLTGHEPANLGDILERVLDRGVIVAGDIRVSLLDIELLTIKLRLLVASVDTARQLGIDWWEHAPWLGSAGRAPVDGRDKGPAPLEIEPEAEPDRESEPQPGPRQLERAKPAERGNGRRRPGRRALSDGKVAGHGG